MHRSAYLVILFFILLPFVKSDSLTTTTTSPTNDLTSSGDSNELNYPDSNQPTGNSDELVDGGNVDVDNNVGDSVDSVNHTHSPLSFISKMLPDALLNYCKHINISPSIFAILLVITFSWIMMYITEQIWSNFREDGQLRDQLCRSHAELFRLKSERDTIEEELSLAKDKFNHRHQDYQEMGDRLSKMEIKMKGDEDENTQLSAKLENLRKHYEEKQRFMEKLDANCKMLEDKVKSNLHSVESLEKESKKLMKQLEETNSSNRNLEENSAELRTSNERLKKELEKSKASVDDLATEKEIIEASVKSVERMKIELDERESEFKALKKLKEDITKRSSEETPDTDYLLGGQLDLEKLKGELERIDSEMKVFSDEKNYLTKRMIELEAKVALMEDNYEKVDKEKEENVKNLSIMKSYFTEKEVKMQTELGALQMDYENTLRKNDLASTRSTELSRHNEELKQQITTLTQDLAKYEDAHRKHVLTLENKYYEIFLVDKTIRKEIENIWKENNLLRQRLNEKIQVNESISMENSLEGASSPLPPNFPSIHNESLSNRSDISDWSLPPPPPVPPSLLALGLRQSPSGQYMGDYQPPPPPINYSTRPEDPSKGLITNRDSFSPISQRSQGNGSVRSDMSNLSKSSNLIKPQAARQVVNPQAFHDPLNKVYPKHRSDKTR